MWNRIEQLQEQVAYLTSDEVATKVQRMGTRKPSLHHGENIDRPRQTHGNMSKRQSSSRTASALADHLLTVKYIEKWVRPEAHVIKFLANMDDITDRQDLWCLMRSGWGILPLKKNSWPSSTYTSRRKQGKMT